MIKYFLEHLVIVNKIVSSKYSEESNFINNTKYYKDKMEHKKCDSLDTFSSFIQELRKINIDATLKKANEIYAIK